MRALHEISPIISPPNGKNAANSLPENTQPLLTRLLSYFQWRDLIVAGKEVKGFVVSPTIAAILLSTILGVIVWAYQSNTRDSRDTLKAITRMETMLEERTKNFEREQDKLQAELKDERTLAKLQRDNQDKKQVQMEYALRAKGIRIE